MRGVRSGNRGGLRWLQCSRAWGSGRGWGTGRGRVNLGWGVCVNSGGGGGKDASMDESGLVLVDGDGVVPS